VSTGTLAGSFQYFAISYSYFFDRTTTEIWVRLDRYVLVTVVDPSIKNIAIPNVLNEACELWPQEFRVVDQEIATTTGMVSPISEILTVTFHWYFSLYPTLIDRWMAASNSLMNPPFV
jgi:hypothetical protein